MRKLSLLCFVLVGILTGARAADAAASASANPPEVDHMVYLSFLPEPAELMADAKASGLTVLRLDQMADKVIVTYKYPDDHTATLGYMLLSTKDKSARVKRTTVVETRPVEREVVYVERPYTRTRVVYRDPWDDFWPPLVLGFGIGYVSGHHSHWHGHYHCR